MATPESYIHGPMPQLTLICCANSEHVGIDRPPDTESGGSSRVSGRPGSKSGNQRMRALSIRHQDCRAAFSHRICQLLRRYGSAEITTTLPFPAGGCRSSNGLIMGNINGPSNCKPDKPSFRSPGIPEKLRPQLIWLCARSGRLWANSQVTVAINKVASALSLFGEAAIPMIYRFASNLEAPVGDTSSSTFALHCGRVYL